LRANNSDYGLCGAVFSSSTKTIQKCVTELEAGTIFINNYSGYTPSLPFNGFKLSGFGTDNGMEAINNYTRVKTIYQ
jgi:acyl-CoA reductase-like NAD-dependent aldehyde dehydrogenase